MPRVLIGGKPVVVLTTQYAVAACQFPTMTSGAPPCVTAQFTSGATRVMALGSPLLVMSDNYFTMRYRPKTGGSSASGASKAKPKALTVSARTATVIFEVALRASVQL